MNMIYNSDHYCVVEFDAHASLIAGGFEIVDKGARREIFLNGVLADDFRRGVADLVASGPTVEDVDAFLSRFDPLMQQRVMLH